MILIFGICSSRFVSLEVFLLSIFCLFPVVVEVLLKSLSLQCYTLIHFYTSSPL